jgi:hypothetical protein
MAELGSVRASAPDTVVIGAGLGMFVSSFLPWHSASFAVLGIAGSTTADAWDSGFGAWFSVLLLVAAAGVTLASALEQRWRAAPSRPLVTLGLTALGLVMLVLHWVRFSDDDGGLGKLGGVNQGGGQWGHIDLAPVLSASSGAGAGLYLGLVAAVLAVVASLLTLRDDHVRLG